MKKNKTTIIASITLVLLVISSCLKDEDLIRYPDFKKGALPNLTKDTTLASFIDRNNFSITNVAFDFSVQEGSEETESAIIMVYYNKSEGYEYETITSWPATITVTADKLQNIIPASVLDVGNLEVGDEFSFTADLILKDGTKIKSVTPLGNIAYSADFQTQTHVERSYIVTYRVSCPSDLAGTYTVLSSGTSTDGGAENNPISNYEYTVTLTDNGGGEYTISDGVAGVYIQWYTIYGYTFETQGVLIDVCGELSGIWQDAFGANIYLSGTLDEATGVLNVEWYNDFGDQCTAVYTPH